MIDFTALRGYKCQKNISYSCVLYFVSIKYNKYRGLTKLLTLALWKEQYSLDQVHVSCSFNKDNAIQ